MISISLSGVVVVSSVAVSVVGTVSTGMILIHMIVAVIGSALTVTAEVSVLGSEGGLGTVTVSLIDRVNLLLGEHTVVAVVEVAVESGVIIVVSVEVEPEMLTSSLPSFATLALDRLERLIRHNGSYTFELRSRFRIRRRLFLR